MKNATPKVLALASKEDGAEETLLHTHEHTPGLPVPHLELMRAAERSIANARQLLDCARSRDDQIRPRVHPVYNLADGIVVPNGTAVTEQSSAGCDALTGRRRLH